MSALMSAVTTAVVGTVGAAIGNFLTVMPSRRFGDFTGFCSVTESHDVKADATEYPIEKGAPGVDHIIRKPDILTWELVFGMDFDPADMYQRLWDLLDSGTIFDADTGLKTYENLVLTSLGATTDSHTGRILKVNLTMREIVLTEAVKTTVPAQEKQSTPAKTASTAQTGKKSTSEASASQAEGHDRKTSNLKQMAKTLGA